MLENAVHATPPLFALFPLQPLGLFLGHACHCALHRCALHRGDKGKTPTGGEGEDRHEEASPKGPHATASHVVHNKLPRLPSFTCL